MLNKLKQSQTVGIGMMVIGAFIALLFLLFVAGILLSFAQLPFV